MGYEKGGRADKSGNIYEHNWTIYKLLDVVEEKCLSVRIETLGDDEHGIDLWIEEKEGIYEAQQCKGRNGCKEYWDYGSFNGRSIWNHFKNILEQRKNDNVSLVSPLSFVNFEDICNRARTNNGSARDFYNYQILPSKKDLVDLFNKICIKMDIDLSTEFGINTARNYFSRMYYRQVPDSELKNIIFSKIDKLFIGDPDIVYGVLLGFVQDINRFGNKIDILQINALLRNKGIIYRNLAHDDRIMPSIMKINEEYERVFKTFSCGFITRKATQRCIDLIEAGKSFIIHGDAGMGKSGCTENIIKHLKDINLAYVAIKLDWNVPETNSEVWSKNMGLPASVSYCLDKISDERAVIIFDQLDALRWTQAHSGNAITVCSQIINEIQLLNMDRKNPISMIFVCRTYDVNNDTGIASLFAENNGWEKVLIGPLDTSELYSVIGDEINNLSSRTKNLLKIPSNLYIWEKLAKGKTYENINATYQLIKEWWKQITKTCVKNNLNSKELEDIKDRIVHFCYEHSVLNAPKAIMKIPGDYEEFLSSAGFIVSEKSVVSFVHQSILDCFFAEEMLQHYYEEGNLSTIIGQKDKQTPGRRYQTQICIQQIAEISEQDLIHSGVELLQNKDVRYSFKYIFIEVLSQLDFSEDTSKCVMELLKDPKWKECVLLSVVKGNCNYVHMLRECGYLDSLYNDTATRSLAIDIMTSIKNEIDDRDVEFIKKYIFDKDYVGEWSLCLWGDISEESDAFFELRLDLYDKYHKLVNRFIDVKELMKKCEHRTIRILSLMLKHKKNSNEEQLYSDGFLYGDSELFVSDYRFLLESLIPLLPDSNTMNKCYDNWSAKYVYKNGLERTCIILIKRAAEICASNEPDAFVDFFEAFFNIGNPLYNEIVLDGMLNLPDSYADYVIEHTIRDSFVNAFEDTSNNGDKLYYTKQLIGKYSAICSDNVINKLEQAIISYYPTNASEMLQYRIDFNKEKNGHHVYWDYWGDLQRELLPTICPDRISEYARSVLGVLKRRNKEKTSIYHYIMDNECSIVASPVDGKKLSINNWIQIMTNPKIQSRGECQWHYKDGRCIGNSLDDFASSFRQFVSENPKEIAEYLLDRRISMAHEAFVDIVFSGLSLSKDVKDVSEEVIRGLIIRFGYNYTSNRASHIAEIIGKIEIVKYKDYFVDTLWDIIERHNNPQVGELVVTSLNDKEGETVDSIVSNAINCVRGKTIIVLSDFYRDDRALFEKYKSKIEEITQDQNHIIRFASLYMLMTVYDYDRTWALELIIKVFKSDYRLLGYNKSRFMMYYGFDEYPADVQSLVIKAYYSSDSRLKRFAGNTIAELYIIKGAFDNIYELYLDADSEQRKAILEIMITYFGILEYKDKAKSFLEIVILIEEDTNNEYIWGRLFEEKSLDLEEDSILIKHILSSKVKRNILSEFSKAVMAGRKLLKYADVILEVAFDIVEKPNDLKNSWGIENCIIKLVFELYDDTATSNREEEKAIAKKCLELWDKMYEKNIGMARNLTDQMLCK